MMAENQRSSAEGGPADAAPAVVPLNVDDPVFSEFPFPSPYGIQQQLMTRIVQTIQRGQVGVFESPTGTGKSISIICSALAWLKRAPKGLDEEGDNKAPGSPPQPLTGTMETTARVVKDSQGNSAPSWLTAALSAATPGVGSPRQRAPAGSPKGDVAGGASGGLRSVRANARVLTAERDNEVLLSRLAMKKKRQRMWKQQRETAKSCLRKRPKGSPPLKHANVDGDAEFLVSETPEDMAGAAAKALSREDEVVAQTHRLLEGDEWDLEAANAALAADAEDEEEAWVLPKIFYCSRTHSQLTQFLKEVRKTAFADVHASRRHLKIAAVPLASRKQLCIHPAVQRLRDANSMNDKCQELRDNATAKSSRVVQIGKEGNPASSACCNYADTTAVRRMRKEVLAEIQDIEGMVTIGKRLRACPYYASRASIASADLVVLPYTMLLHRATRESLGIDLRDSVVVLDEAHNIIESINSAYSCGVTLGQAAQAGAQLQAYIDRYKTRFSPGNAQRLRQLRLCIGQLVNVLRGPPATLADSLTKTTVSNSQHAPRGAVKPAATVELQVGMMKINQFLQMARLDNINLFELDDYMETSELCNKLQGFHEKFFGEGVQVNNIKGIAAAAAARDQSSASIGSGSASNDKSPLRMVKTVLHALTQQNADGRLKLSYIGSAGCDYNQNELRFVMLNPGRHFQEIVEAARSTILLGGTMEPIPFVVNQLFGSYLPSSQVQTLACGHVVPDEHLRAVVVARGPSGKNLRFSFDRRTDPAQMRELGRVLCNAASVVPQGMVVFLPSFAYASQLRQFWSTDEHGQVIARLAQRKRLFWEEQSGAGGGAGQVGAATVLQRFAAAIPTDGKGGAMLFCVVGAKMSEGINFSDGLARCVVMVGLPFPNPSDPELRERMAYFDRTAVATDSPAAGTSKSPGLTAAAGGQEYYENICMRAVNQSIGRAIRHRLDHATILLVDERYGSTRIRRKLPRWIDRRVTAPQSFGLVVRELATFFRFHRSRVQGEK